MAAGPHTLPDRVTAGTRKGQDATQGETGRVRSPRPVPGAAGVAVVTGSGHLHEAGKEFTPYAAAPTPGSADLCLITTGPVDTVAEELARAGVQIEEGPVGRTGATGTIRSVHVLDPTGTSSSSASTCSGSRGRSARGARYLGAAAAGKWFSSIPRTRIFR